MRLWRRHCNLSAWLALCALALNSRAETTAGESIDSRQEAHSPAQVQGPRGGSDAAMLFASAETGLAFSSVDSPAVSAGSERGSAPSGQAGDTASTAEHPAAATINLRTAIQLPGVVDASADDMGAILRAAALLENAGTVFDIETPIAMNRRLLGREQSQAAGSDRAPTELALTASTALSISVSRADLMTVDAEHVDFTIPAGAASASAAAVLEPRRASDPAALPTASSLDTQQSAALIRMVAPAEHKEHLHSDREQFDTPASITLIQAAEPSLAVPSTAAAAAAMPDAENTSASALPLPAAAAASPLAFHPEQLRRDPKSLKERFNYASSDCAAVVLKANREARGLTSILNSKKDMYMLNECSARSKFVIVELCDDILVDTLVLGNYEFFSSTFRDTMVYVSDRYPPKENSTWTLLGHFQARNSRDAQVFPVIDPKIWARYIKVEFLTHYGQEFYCPLTVLKVYGATQMEQYRKEEEEDGGDFIDTATLTIDLLMGTPALDYQLRFPYHKQLPSQLRIGEAASPAKAYLRDMQGLVDGYVVRDEGEPLPVSAEAAAMPKVPNLPWGQANVDDEDENDDGDDEEEEEEDDDEEDTGEAGDNLSDIPSGESGKSGIAADATLLVANDGQVYRPEDGDGGAAGAEHGASERLRQQQLRDHQQEQQQPGDADRAKRGQESIFKTIMRRLARVERNVTLAYHYLEEQHMVFNLVLQQVEMNNLENMQLAIKQLNHSTAKQMQSLTALSEEVWRAILYDLEAYQQSTKTEMGEMARKLEFLAEEVLFEKRMNVAQLVLLFTIVVMIAVNKVATKLALIPESKKEK